MGSHSVSYFLLMIESLVSVLDYVRGVEQGVGQEFDCQFGSIQMGRGCEKGGRQASCLLKCDMELHLPISEAWQKELKSLMVVSLGTCG